VILQLLPSLVLPCLLQVLALPSLLLQAQPSLLPPSSCWVCLAQLVSHALAVSLHLSLLPPLLLLLLLYSLLPWALLPSLAQVPLQLLHAPYCWAPCLLLLLLLHHLLLLLLVQPWQRLRV
jgi:hypothetical protein